MPTHQVTSFQSGLQSQIWTLSFSLYLLKRRADESTLWRLCVWKGTFWFEFLSPFLSFSETSAWHSETTWGVKGLVRWNGFVSRKYPARIRFSVPSWDNWTLRLESTAGLFFLSLSFFILWHRILNLLKSPFKTQLVLSACRLSVCDSLSVCACVCVRLSRVFDRSSPSGTVFYLLVMKPSELLRVWTSAPVCHGSFVASGSSLCPNGLDCAAFFFFPHPTQRVVQTVLPSFNNKTGHETKKKVPLSSLSWSWFWCLWSHSQWALCLVGSGDVTLWKWSIVEMWSKLY